MKLLKKSSRILDYFEYLFFSPGTSTVKPRYYTNSHYYIKIQKERIFSFYIFVKITSLQRINRLFFFLN